MKVDEKKSHKRFREIPEREIRAAILWVKDDIHILPLMKEFGCKTWGSTVYARLACGLRQAYREGRLKVIKK